MAKTKEKEVELKPRVEKISGEHLQELQQVVNRINGTQFNIGKIELQKHTLLHDLAIAQDKVTMLQDKLMKEYGSYDVNLSDGSINWPENTPGIEKPKGNEK
tara:strand:+ start:28 stop:333 length:306 start_codon:yes stop_codon:yes gene_type:complete